MLVCVFLFVCFSLCVCVRVDTESERGIKKVVSGCLPVIHLSLVQKAMSITDDGVEDLLPAKHLCLEQL